MSWRYIAQRVLTGEILDWDLPLHIEDLTWTLSGAGDLRATLAPDVGALRDSAGRLMLEEWGTLIYAEASGEIRWGGILTRSEFAGEQWSIEAISFAGYPHGVPYLGSFSATQIDPVDAVREIWRHLQAYNSGNLNVLVTGAVTTSTRLGDPGKPESQELYYRGGWVPASSVPEDEILPSTNGELAEAMDSSQTTLELLHYVRYDEMTPPYTITVGDEKIVVNGRTGHTLTGLERGSKGTTPAAHAVGSGVYFPGTPARTVEAVDPEPYELRWYEAPDCGAEIDDLATATPFDYTERHTWNADRSDITHEIVLHYPRAGRRRTDLAFVQGDNVSSVVAFESQGDEFANAIHGIGAGEGRAVLHRSTGYVDGRLRRPHVYTDKGVKDGSRLSARIRDELERRRGLLQITSIDVTESPSARIGSWIVGDDILVRADVPWLGDVSLWCRVIAWSLTSETTATLQLARSDSFRYGG